MDVKICGLGSEQTVDVAIASGASHVGFVFYPLSPRHVGPSHAGELAKRAKDQRVSVVAVTVDAGDGMLDAIVETVGPDMLQLHGKEEAYRVEEIKDRYGLPVMKAIAVETADDLSGIDEYADIADKLLFDAKAPKGAVLPGGNGVSFDWSILKDLKGDWFLSGGLSPDNVQEALRVCSPGGLDVSSSLESAPGTKDPERIRAFFAAIREAEAA
ncbi:phosphoribosylanthranilate isomerase [Notoacmeibacter ruber]|uniref:N-(5'-phosphoribosyl)anthranilate isomerase n=1 Tax=Notoacmeibacter ruber TaxID=2670375 RepID=A0A3L7JEM1_9HYPH|nr:phosphoribosylanthranilate isomerase [Notoacmeibacter ruber]RLQ89238.1 phosphoribosylanthranilate isomerase [Notoacmeibacter ruber]